MIAFMPMAWLMAQNHRNDDDDNDYNLYDDATDGMLHLRVAVNYTKSGQANEKPFWNCS